MTIYADSPFLGKGVTYPIYNLASLYVEAKHKDDIFILVAIAYGGFTRDFAFTLLHVAKKNIHLLN